MLETSARLLVLLSALQSRRFWAGPELAEHLGVTDRTLRRDVDRLRSLGYVVDAISGPGGGYQLGRGAELPPLVFDEDEAVAVAAALGDAALGAGGAGDPAMRALIKLDGLLPRRLRARASALASSMLTLGRPRVRADPEVLVTLAAAARDRVAVTFRYEALGGAASQRQVEPLRLVRSGHGPWYLVAFDPGRGAWRTFRVDRVRGRPRVGERFAEREPPADLEAYVSSSIAVNAYPCKGRVRVRGSLAALQERIPPWSGTLTPIDGESCALEMGAPEWSVLAGMLVMAGVDFDQVEPEELAEHLRGVGERLRRACAGRGEVSGGGAGRGERRRGGAR
ncbi:MAG: WYL domain-containing protein [Nannocystaceae bacterium]